MGSVQISSNSAKASRILNLEDTKIQVSLLSDPSIDVQVLEDIKVDITKTQEHHFTINDCCDRVLRVADVLPFRVRFKTIDIAGYSPTNPAPIGIAIIGYSNYIL